jgi:hypothetical protein
VAVVVFDPATFKIRYPEFSAVSDDMLSACFNEAALYLSNANNSPVQDVTRRALLFNMLVAHIAFLGGKLSADGMPRPVGRASSASEGSVSVGLEYMVPGTYAWFTQSQYGASFWQATSSLRGFRYLSMPTTY